MSIAHSHLNTAVNILDQYKGEQPFASFLRQYFSKEKKYGSKDRKQIGHLCYSFFRLGRSVMNLTAKERILLALFLCDEKASLVLSTLRPEWVSKIELPLIVKLKIINEGVVPEAIFPWVESLSTNIDPLKFNLLFLVQPDFFLRIRPGKKDLVTKKLKEADINFKELDTDCLSLNNTARIDQVVRIDKEVVVQDYSSQRTGELLKELLDKKIKSVWDCCAASGGKSIMAVDILGDIDLTVSDVRESIMANLKKRFASAGIKRYKSFIADLTIDNTIAQKNKFDLVIADVPCSGSGTWSRTPEQLFYFDESKIEKYSDLQKKIMSNVIPAVKPGGFLLYITCSVFSKENEEMVIFVTQQTGLVLVKSVLLKGYEIKADTMFAALLQKPL